MSLQSAFNTIVRRSLRHPDLLDSLGLSVYEDGRKAVRIGIPDDPFNRAPTMYAQPFMEDRNRTGLQRTITISTISDVVVIYTFHKRDIPSPIDDSADDAEDSAMDRLLDWMLQKSQVLIDRVNADNDTGVYLQDGDRGFAAFVRQTQFYFRPEDPVSGIRFAIRVESYH